jgi:hypothetical protein
MLSRSFSPSKLPRPPPPPPIPRTKRKRGHRRRKNDDADQQHASLESPLVVQQVQSNAEYLEQRCDNDEGLGSVTAVNHPKRQDHLYVSGDGSHDDNGGVSAAPTNQSGLPLSPSSSFDEAGSEASASASWRQRLRWFHVFQRKHRSSESTIVRSRSNDHDDGSCRDNAKPFPPHSDGQNRTIRLLQPATYWHSSQHPNKTTKIGHSQSMLGGDHSRLEDFDESEWTPPDSSYGAAIPIAGWIPKSIRRTIECTLIAVVLGCIVFFVVETSVRADSKSRNHKSNNSDLTVYNTSWNYYADDQYAYGFDNATSSNNTFDDDMTR